MGFIKKFILEYKNKVAMRNNLCNGKINEIDTALSEINALFSDMHSFIEPTERLDWSRRNSGILSDSFTADYPKLKKAINYKKLLTKQAQLSLEANSLKDKISNHNNKVAETKLPYAYNLIGNVEGRTLDRQQTSCIVKEMHNHLVIAGAGTGKTTTVVGKIKFLLNSGKYSPEEILVLSFTNASASEMSERIFKETGQPISASTFHKLGLNIITSSNGKYPKISQLNLRKYIREQLALNMQSDSYLNLLSLYLFYNRVIPKSEFEFKTLAEYNEYLKINPPTTVNKETVKSYGEMDIANFLMQNGIRYEYEKPYEIDTRNEEHRQYCPDFYLPDYGIYIEYFGINRNGEVPPFFSHAVGKTPSQTYRESMDWKRQTHKKNGTVLIECYSYEKSEGILLTDLKAHLEKHNVTFNPISAKEMWEKVASESESVLDGITELFETVINLIKSNDYTIDDVREINKGNFNSQSNELILSLIEPIFNAYCNCLKENDEIDFNDMINSARKCVEEKKYVNPYKYVIVDEYQDISKARFLLLKSMRESQNFDLFCVGDDWQSIYRFAGSDIGYILNFENYWGPAEISKIETTYRFAQKLIEISGTFVMQNPMQIRKSIKGKTDSDIFPLEEINGYTEKNAITFTCERLDFLPKESTVFFIGRYSFDINLIKDDPLFKCSYDTVSGLINVKYIKRPDLKIKFITAHKSKGLQADFVFILNNKKSRMGFPSKIQDAPILSLLLDNCDTYPFAEERRLLYVAMTRAKNKCYILTQRNRESIFAQELKLRYGNRMIRHFLTCPLCGGRLIKKTGPYGEFYGCSNYKSLGCKYKKAIK